MQYTRKQILEYLKIHHTASVPELSQALSLTLGNIRHHIKELESQKILELAGIEPVEGRGRPILRYQLSPHSMEHNLIPLLETMLKQNTQGLTTDTRLEFFQKIANQMISVMDQPRSPAQRIHLAVRWLNSHHYQARWEAYATGPRIILGYCPYLALVPGFPRICELDIAIVSQLTGLPMVLSPHQEHPRHPPCTFTAVAATRSEIHE